MQNRFWHKITVRLPSIFESEGSALLIELGAKGVWVETSDDRVQLNVYFPESVSVDAAKALIQNALTALTPEETITLHSEKLPEESWQTAWQAHSIPVQQIGQRLDIVPLWEQARHSASNRKVILLSPGMAFGTGTHATTRNCLILLEKAVLKMGQGRMLDFGTGSGILAIAAAKLGVTRITATEIDPVALDAARKNARTNRVVSKIKFCERIPSRARYTGLTANVTTSVLLALKGPLIRAVLPGGFLILSGMLKGAHTAVLEAYAKTCVLIQCVEEENWVTLWMRKK